MRHKRNALRQRFEPLERREMLSATTIESEPNDIQRLADAVAIDPADGAAEISGSIGVRRDRDFFTFKANAASTVDLSMASADGLIGKVTVEDRFGNKLFETEPNNGVNSGSFNVNAGQQVFVRVRGERDTTGGYVVSLSLDASAAVSSSPARLATLASSTEPANTLDEIEPNNTQATATKADLGSDGLLTLRGTSTSDADKDFFVFTAATSGKLTVQVGTTNGRRAKLTVEDKAGNKLFETEPNNDINGGAFNVIAGTTYFVRLRSPNKAPAAYLVDLALS